MLDNYFANQTLSSPLIPQQLVDPIQVQGFSGSNLISPQTITFVDQNISDAMTVMANLQSDVKVLLDPTRDGVSQITEILGLYKNLTGVNIISHANVAQLQLGKSLLSAESLSQYTSELQKWSVSLATGADILFYGCNVAFGQSGQAFVANLSSLTGADIAASTNSTGNSLLGGDWMLEYSTGSIETANPLSNSLMSSYQGIFQSVFTTQAPVITNATDGTGSNGDYELGMEFQSAKAGTIDSIRYYKAASETGTHVGRIWSSTGTLLASVTFANETASGWQQQALATPLTIAANTKYVVSVNVNQFYVATSNGLASTLTNGDISAIADGSNGVFNETPSAFPTQSFNNANYFRDIVFTATAPVNNTTGTVALTGTATQNQTLSAAVNDANGLNGVTINYQWQQSTNGTTWTNVTGATNSTLTLGQAQVGNQVRVNATYIDALGSSENILSTPTTVVANVNDLGTVAIAGSTVVGQVLTANVSDLDGLNGVTSTYQWQQSSNGTTWTNVSGATTQTLTLGSTLVGNQLRVNTTYTDALGTAENIISNPTSAITSVAATQSLFTTQLPVTLNATDGTGSNGDYELGMEFQSAKAGTINSIRYYKAASETGTHVGRIWSSTGTLLASVTFANETASGWQQQALATPLTIAANTKYVVSVNVNQFYVSTNNGLASTLTNGDISAIADGSNGVFNETPSAFPTQSFNNSNYFRDIVFTATAPVNNTTGTVALTGTATQNQTLSAAVNDANGLNGVTINYQWQQSTNGTTWTNVTGATNSTLTLGQAQVGNQVRVNATYIDALGSSENILSTPTTVVANVNDLGTVAIAGSTVVGQVLTANVSDLDGLNGVTPTYQWQQSSNGTTWTNVSGATTQTLTLGSTLVGNQLRVNTTYTDALGTAENIISNPTSAITSVAATQSLFTTQLPVTLNATDGTGSNGDYELGMEFQSAKAGTISSIRYYKAASETGTHVGRIWSSTGTLLASVTFANETASGWQQQALATPLTIAANTKYVVSVNVNQFYVSTNNGLASTLTNGDISAIADGSNGVFNETPSAFPTQSFNNSNYFRDIVFTATAPVNNTTGTVALTGTATQNQTLSAAVNDANGLNGVTINYQWQQSTNGTTWTNVTGATNSTLTLGQAQVGNQVRVNATYIDALGSSENIFSTPTTVVANVNDLGTVAIAGSTVVGQVLTANVSDLDGLNGVTPTYQWQQSSNGTTWTNVSGATTQTLTLGSTLVGNQLRVNTTYTDALGTAENIISNPTSAITSVAATQSLFTTQLPVTLNATDGTGSNGDYELGMEFQSAKAGTISSIRYYKAASETGTHVGRIWSSTGTLLASVTFANETASGWQQQALATPLTIAANTKYVVSVNVNQFYVSTNNGLASTLTNGDISAIADGSNGVFNETPSAFPTQSFNNSNYFRDIVFTATAPVNNTTGTVALTGTATQNQTLSAAVNDANGLNGVTINYQWQQSTNGTTWTNVTGATNSTLTLGQAQVGNQVRVNATYIDALGSSENIFSTPTTVVANVNDLGTVAIAGSTVVGQVLTANVSDLDGLNGVTPTYQWQQSSNGTTWTNVSGATTQTLTLGSTLVGNQLRVNTTYTDALGTAENIISNPTSAITSVAATQSLFTTQLPVTLNATDGTGSNGDYELGMEFQSAKAGTINSIRYYKAASETGTHVGRIWSSTGTLLASVTFANETASGWQQQALATPLTIAANTKYVVSVNVNQFYVATSNGLASTLTNGDISAIADGSNGVFNETPSAFPTQSFNNANYFRDIVFTATAPVNNTTGTVALTGTATQNQTLSAAVNDANGLNGVTINYQWQQSTNGTTWTNVTGATNSTLTLGQAQVGNQVRVNATYIDALGSSENILSTPTTVVANVNDLGTVAIAGSTVVGQVLTANVSDLDGLNGVTSTYQWQQSSNGTTWTNVSGATTQTLTLGSTLVGNQLRVNTTYTDALGTAENIISNPTSAITSVAATQSLFTTQLPVTLNATDGTGSNGDYELGMEFQSAKAGTINSIRYYKAASETGTHVGRIWSSNGVVLASVTFTNETASGWQEQSLATPLIISANNKYVVSVNVNQFYVATANGLSTTLTNGDISAVADGSNGVFNEIPNNFPTQSFNNTNYFRDIVFTAFAPNPNNIIGTVTINGTVTEDQILTAAITDPDGFGRLLGYQWQESTNNGVTWLDITGATGQTLTLGDKQVAKSIRVRANYVDALGTSETVFSSATNPVVNINDVGLSILSGSSTITGSLLATVLDDDGLTGSTINYKWQQLLGSVWTDITGATQKTLNLGSSFLGFQVRSAVSYTDARNTFETIFSSGTTVTQVNPIVLENQKTGTRNWEIAGANKATSEIVGYGDATSINKGQAINLKISLAQAGQYQIDVYRLGYYGGAGGRLITSVTGLNGIAQAGQTLTPDTRLVEYNWNTSYTLQTGSDWTSGLYLAKLTDSSTGKQNYIQFTLRDDNRPTDIGFQESISTAASYNSYGGYSVYDFNSNGGQRAYQVSFDRPFQYNPSTNSEQFNNTLTWEYNMARWLESQGYDVSYFTNLDVSINPLQLYSQKTFLSVGHDEYWSMEQRDNVEKARDNGINLAFFSANTAYWQVRYEASTSGQANRVMTVYKDSSGVGSFPSIDPIAQTNPIAATTLFRSSLVNRPENALLGVAYIGDWGAGNVYNGRDYVISNAADPYFANTGLQNGDRLVGLVGYEWDAVLNNGFSPTGLVVLSASPVPSGGLTPLGLLPPGTNDTISNSVRYTAASGAKVFATGSVQWVWGLDSDRVTNPRVDPRAQQIAVNVFADMGAKPQTPNAGIVV